MPNVNITLPETSQSVFRPVIINIVSQVQKITKIASDTKIFFPGDSESMQTYGAGINREDKSPLLNTDRYNFIEVTEDFDLDDLSSTNVDGRGNEPVFLDSKLQVVMSPIYVSSQVVVNFKYRAFSKTEALRWRDDMRIRVSQMREMNLHSIDYSYLLSPELVKLLREIYNLREKNLGYGDSFEEYFVSHTVDRLALVSDQAGKEADLVITETQSRIIGLYDFDALPEKPERDDGTGTWTISFSYKFKYDKPIGCNIRYPIMVHNQLLPIEYTYFNNKQYNLDMVNKRYSESLRALSMFESDRVMNTSLDPRIPLRLPTFDDFILPSAPGGTGSVFTALCEVADDKRTLLGLKELGDIELDSDVLEFIQGIEYPYITKLFKSIIYVGLYKDNNGIESSALECDINLNIKATRDLDLRSQHRVRVALLVDISYLDKNAIDRLRKYPKAFVKIIGAINEILRNHKEFNNLGNRKIITMDEFNDVLSVITGYRYQNDSTLVVANNWPYSSSGINYYTGRPVSKEPMGGIDSKRGVGYRNFLFRDLDPRVVESYRRNSVTTKTVMVSGIVAIN